MLSHESENEEDWEFLSVDGFLQDDLGAQNGDFEIAQAIEVIDAGNF